MEDDIEGELEYKWVESPPATFFDMPPYRYDRSCVPKGFTAQTEPYSTGSYITSVCNGDELRYLWGGAADILEFKTVDPNAKLVFCVFRYTPTLPEIGEPGSVVNYGSCPDVIQEDTVVIHLPPGTYRILASLLSNQHVLIQHHRYPDYEYTRYLAPRRMKISKLSSLRIYATIAERELYYQNGMIHAATSHPAPSDIVKVQIPNQMRPLTDYQKRCCPTCHQTWPESPRTKTKRERKNVKRLPENYPGLFKRKIYAILYSGLLRSII